MKDLPKGTVEMLAGLEKMLDSLRDLVIRLAREAYASGTRDGIRAVEADNQRRCGGDPEAEV